MRIESDLGSLLAESRAKSHSLISGSSFTSRLQKESQIYRPKDWWAEMAVGRTGSLPKHVATPHVLYDQLLQLFKGSVFICAGAVADKAASMPASVYRMRYRKSGEYRERVSRNHPCVRLLESPHPRLTAFDMHYQNFGWLQVCGDAYMHKQKNAFGIPVRLNPLSPQWVKIIPGELNFVDGYRVNSLYIGTQDYDIPANEMLHFQKKSLDWSNTRRFYGMSTIIAAENTVQLEAEMLQRLRHKFSNLANPGLVFKTKRRLNEAQLKQNLDAIWMQHRLAEHEGKPMLVHDDMDLISGADGKTQELDYRGSLEDTLKITSAAFGVPLAVVGLVDGQNKCHDEETECLTDSGWITYDKISHSTKIACYNSDTQGLEYHSPSSVFVNDYSGDMVKFSHRCADVMVTPNHRVWGRPGCWDEAQNGPWQFKEASEWMKTGTFKILVAPPSGANFQTKNAFVEIEHVKLRKSGRGRTASLMISTDTWAKFLGWFLSEGSITLRNINKNGQCITCISQKKENHVIEIEELLAEMPFKWHKQLNKKTGVISWKCSDRGLYEHLKANCYTDRYRKEFCDKDRPVNLGAHCKRMPSYCRQWGKDETLSMLETAIAGDGHRNGSADGTHCRANYATTSSELADDIQEMAVKCGFWATKSEGRNPHRKNRVELYRVGISFTRNSTLITGRSQFSDKKQNQRSVEKYSGKVWCVEVPTGLFVVRRGGRVHISGNSNAEAALSTFAHNKLNPMLIQYSQTLTNQVAKDFEDDLIIEIGPFTVRDYKEIVNGAQALWRAGAITPNEIRDHLLNLPPLDQGGDTPVLPAGVQLATYGNDIGDGLRSAGGDERSSVDPSYFANMMG